MPALTHGLSSEFDWQQISSGLQDSFQYSNRSHQCFGLDGISISSDFQIFQPPFQYFEDRSKCTIYNRYHRHSYVPLL